MSNTKWKQVSIHSGTFSKEFEANIRIALAGVSVDDETVSFSNLDGLMVVASVDPFAPNKAAVFLCNVLAVTDYEKVTPKAIGFAEAFGALQAGKQVTRLTCSGHDGDSYRMIDGKLKYHVGNDEWEESDVGVNELVARKFRIEEED